MSDLAQRQLAAVRAYQAEHPDVDWSTHVVQIRPTKRPYTADSEWVAVNHQLKDPSWDALDMCCCHPDLPRHHD